MSAGVATSTVPDIDLDAEKAAAAAEAAAAGHGEKAHGAETAHAKSSGHGGHHHKARGGHGGAHGGGGHGGNWLVTYCDMITLLIAFFICILTFASKENGKQTCPRLRDSLVYGPGGTGAIGPRSANADSVLWRQYLASANPNLIGSRTAPRFADPQVSYNEQVLDSLDQAADTILDDSFSFRVPLVVLQSESGALSPAGQRLLGNIAFGLRQFPFDLILQIEDPKAFSKAFQLMKHVTDLANCPPSRAGISLVEDGTRQQNSVRFLFVSRQK